MVPQFFSVFKEMVMVLQEILFHCNDFQQPLLQYSLTHSNNCLRFNRLKFKAKITWLEMLFDW